MRICTCSFNFSSYLFFFPTSLTKALWVYLFCLFFWQIPHICAQSSPSKEVAISQAEALWEEGAYEAYYRQVDSLVKAPEPIRDFPSQETWLMRITYAANYMGQTAATIEFGEQLLKKIAYQTTPRDTAIWVSTLSWVGQQYFAKGNFARTISYLSQAETLRKDPNGSEAAYYADQIGNAYFQLAAINAQAFPDQEGFAEADSARKYFTLSYQRYRLSDSSMLYLPLYNLALLEQRVGDAERALEIIRELKSLSTYDPLDQGIPNLMGAALQRLGRLEEAKQAFLLVDSLASLSGKADEIMIAQNNLGSIYTELKTYPQALACLTKAAALLDSLDLGFNWEQQGTLAQNLAEVYHEQGDLTRANAYLSQVKLFQNRQLLESLEQAADNAREFQRIENERLESLEALHASQERAILLLKVLVAALVVLLILGIIIGSLNRKQVLQKHQLKEQEFELGEQKRLHDQQVNQVLQDTERKILYEKNKAQDQLMERMGKELHDQVASTMTACKRSLENLFLAMEPLSDDLRTRSKKSLDSLGAGISSVRKISHDLANLSLDNGLVQALEHLVSELNDLEKDLSIDLSTFQLKQTVLPNRIEYNVFRMLQEALTNILKHAQARHASLQLIYTEGMLNISIEDDGRGFNPEKVANGLGMRSMRERAEELHGKMTVDSRPGFGTSLFIDIPLKPST
ncbi:MAG: sensor histidine kinase [Bacteroidota bacterium]